MKRMAGVLTVTALVFVTASACTGNSGGNASRVQPSNPSSAATDPTATTIYEGTVEMRHQIIGADANASDAEVTTVPARVEIGPALAAEGDGTEKNPFHLEVISTPLGSNETVDGSLYLKSSFAQPNEPPPPNRVVIDDWSYDGSLDSFKGSLTRLISGDIANYVTTGDNSDTLPGGPTVCMASMKRGTTLEGSASGDAVRIHVSGAGGGYNTSGTCLTEITFEADITAKRTGTYQTPPQ